MRVHHIQTEVAVGCADGAIKYFDTAAKVVGSYEGKQTFSFSSFFFFFCYL